MMSPQVESDQELSKRILRSTDCELRSIAVKLWSRSIEPPQRGHYHTAAELAWDWAAFWPLGVGIRSSCWQTDNNDLRRRLARKPKKRMRTKPCGRTWRRKRRRNSSAVTVISFCLLPCA